jgi:hypothetical protein
MSTNHLASSRKRAGAIASILCIISCKNLPGVHAFTTPSKQTYFVHIHQHLCTNHNIIRLRASKDDDSEKDDEENNALLNELRDKKKETFGTDIPLNDELQQAAKNSENAFLAAMLEQTQSFKEIKSEKGGDAAVSEFRRRIQEGDEAQRLEDANNAAQAEVSIDKKWFVQQMEEGMKESEEGIDDDSWQ